MVVLHKPLFVEEEEEKCDSEVVLAEPENLIHPVLQCVVPSEFVQHLEGDLERVVVELDSSPPHLFLYLFYSSKQKWRQEGTLPV